MGDKSTLEKARRELEEMYLGIPDDTVNLSFQDLAKVQHKKIQQQHSLSLEKKKSLNLQKTLSNQTGSSSSSLNKLPSLDFNQSIEASRHHFRNDHVQYPDFRHPIPTDNHHDLHHVHGGPTTACNPSEDHPHQLGHHQVGDHMQGHGGHHHATGHYHGQHTGHHSHHAEYGHHHQSAEFGHHRGVETSVAFGDMSGISMTSMVGGHNGKARGRRWPGIPHSNICTICSTYVYFFRHRCLVCGRVYCKECVRNGMGEMAEGRKCIQCLGRRYSQRYIQKAGKMGCCMGYPNMVKQEELKWAEKGPRRSGEIRYGQSTMMPRSPSPMTPRNPSSQIHSAGNKNTDSFVMNSSPYSPYSSSHANFPVPL